MEPLLLSPAILDFISLVKPILGVELMEVGVNLLLLVPLKVICVTIISQLMQL